MKILLASPEVYPYSKAGGVADFSASLPKALNKYNNVTHVITPLHKVVKDNYSEQLVLVSESQIDFKGKKEKVEYFKIEEGGINYYFVGHKYYNKTTFFGHDNDMERYFFFNLAILEFIKVTNFYPDVIHMNDWTTALIPFFIDNYYGHDQKFKSIKTLLTIHNLEKQGAFPKVFENLFIHKNFTYLHLDQINFLKAGIMRSTKINTVSKSYRSEMLTKFFGFGLDGALKSRQADLYGIQNGLDFDLYNPNTDKYIEKTYNNKTVKEGKLVNKKALLKELDLHGEEKMLISFIGRFAKQKGLDLIMELIEDYLEDDAFNFVVVGQGDWKYERYFTELALNYPNNFKYIEGLKHRVSQRVYAASDLFLMPSLFESSGLNQMIAQRYGAIPLVRHTGGLIDTVASYSKETKIGNGFSFENFDEEELKASLDLALYYYQNEQDHFNNIIKNTMSIDKDLTKMAEEYQQLYLEMVKDK